MPTSQPVSDLHRRFFDAAFGLLADEGYGALKVRGLCDRLSLTTGAFYHAFDGWKPFLVALLDDWRRERTQATTALVQAEPDGAQRLDTLIEAALTLTHGAEAAIRVWAGVDPEVGRVVELVDAERLQVVTDAFVAVTADAELSARLATTALYLLVGFEQARVPRDLATLRWAMQGVRDQAVAGSTTHGSRG